MRSLLTLAAFLLSALVVQGCGASRLPAEAAAGAPPTQTEPDAMPSLPDFDDARFASAALYTGTTRVNGFAFRAGQGLPAHRVPAEAFLLVTEGAVRVTVGDAAHRLGAGDGIVLPGGVPHALDAAEDARVVLVRAR